MRRGHSDEIEHAIKVKFKSGVIDRYATDLLVDDKVWVELKVAPKYNPQDEVQSLNELKAIEIKVGLLINFRKGKVEFKRFI